MSVLLVSENFPPRIGGAGTYAAELCRSLPAGSVAVLTHEPGDPRAAAAFDAGFPHPVARVPMQFESWGKLGLRGWRRYAALNDAVRRALPEGATSLLANRCLPEGEAVRCVAAAQRLPYAVVVHGEELNTASTSRELAFLTRRVLHRAARVVANSQHTRSLLVGQWGVSDKRIAVVTPGVDVNAITPADPAERDTLRARLAWPDAPVVLTAGRLQHRKGHDRMIEAWRSVAAELPAARWVVIGDGPRRAALQDLAYQRGVADSIVWRGDVPRDELIASYRAADLFALPNRTVDGDFEGFGIVLLEAQAAGRPTICGRSGGAPETLVDRVTGRVVDATSSAELANTLLDLLLDPSELERMGRQARAHVEVNHARPRATTRFTEALHALGVPSTHDVPSASARELAAPPGLRPAA
ncbi:MAG: glycosyltransferase family 4 protein [Planctomycetota bacterium]